jgi:hypothetical protein
VAAATYIMAAVAAVVVAGTTDGETVDTDTMVDTRAVVMEIMVNPITHLHLVEKIAEVPREEFPAVEVLAVGLVLDALLVEVPAAEVPVVVAVLVVAVLVVAVLVAAAAVLVAAVPVVAAEEAVESSMTIFTANRIRNSQQDSLP